MPLLGNEQQQEFAGNHPEWTIEGGSITRTFKFGDFPAAIGFVTQLAILAEKVFHHPDIDIRYNRVTVTLTTHDQGGLTERDTALAARIDSI